MNDGLLPYGIIPARAASSRFPGKVIATISNKPMIQHIWETASRARCLGGVVIATDDDAVAEVAKSFGAEAVITPDHFTSGTDRVAYIARALSSSIIINLQADEPLLPVEAIEALVIALQKDPMADIATLAVKRQSRAELLNPNIVKVVFNRLGQALYFSRQPLAVGEAGEFYKHIGIYAYRREALLKFCELPASSLEVTERLEQLRALENGMVIRVVMTDRDTISVDIPEDVEKVEERLRGR